MATLLDFVTMDFKIHLFSCPSFCSKVVCTLKFTT